MGLNWRFCEGINARLAKIAGCTACPFLFLVRLYWGWGFLQAGWGKFTVQGLDKVAGFFGNIGIPLPMANAVLVSTVETVGGLLLILGLCTRVTTVPLIITMIVAMITTESEALGQFFSDPGVLIASDPFQYFFAMCILFCFGAGMISLDGWCAKKNGKGCC
jgi:putative oxidoreductase